MDSNKVIEKLKQENQQLKQQLHDLPNKTVEEVRQTIWEECREYYNAEEEGIIQYTEITPKKVNIILERILEKYGGEDE